MEHKKHSQPGNHPSKKRIAEIRKALQAAKGQVSEADAKKRLEKDDDFQKVLEQYPLQADFDEKMTEEEKIEQVKKDMISAEVRKKVSKAMFEKDKELPPEIQAGIIERQINRFYDFEVGKKGLMGHVDSPHGTKTPPKIEKWCEDRKISDYEKHTNEITEKTTNRMIFKKIRLIADVNSLPKDVESSLRSEGAVYSKEDNLNAIKAQRDLTAKMLAEQDNLTDEGKAHNPYLAIHLHGKTDSRGHDFEIAAKVEDGKGPLNPLLAFWIAERLKEKVGQKKMKNLKGETPTVNVVTYKGAYSGSNALMQLRHGDGTFGFEGFGENFHALQLECGAHMRGTYQNEMGQILNELMEEFTAEFKTAGSMKKLEKYQEAYDQKLAKEKDELFSTKKVGFKDEIPETAIGLNKALREVLGVEKGDKVMLKGKELTVRMIKSEDLKLGNNMLLHPSWKDQVGEKLELTKAGEQDGGGTNHGSETHGGTHDKDHGEPKAEQKTGWRNRLKFFFGLVGDRIKSILGIDNSHGGGHGGAGHASH